MFPKCPCSDMRKAVQCQAGAGLGSGTLVLLDQLEYSSLKMLTSSQEQKQLRDEIHCDAESTWEINASLSSHDPSSLCFKSGTMEDRAPSMLPVKKK